MALTHCVLEIVNISKSYGAKSVLDGVSLLINRNERIGLVGENGSGKSTLANIIMGSVQADSGEVRRMGDLDIGYLPQEAAVTEDISVQRYLERSVGQIDDLRMSLQDMEQAMAVPGLDVKTIADLLERYGQAQEAFARQGGYEADYRFDQVLAGLDLVHVDRSRSMKTLSGGEKTRVSMASLLLRSPGLLILDEPTNHLDFGAVDWLESYLQTYPGAVLVISHDRYFLNRVVGQIAELSPAGHDLTIYHGNYDAYLAGRERLRAEQAAAYEAQQEEIKRLQRLIKMTTHNAGQGKPPRDNDKFAKGFKGGRLDGTASREIHNAQKRLDALLADPVARPVRRWQINPDFAPEELTSQDVIRLNAVSKRYGDRVLLDGASATVQNRDRVVLYGANGVGKTTLVKLILGLEQPDSGSIRVSSGARIGYLDQEQESLDVDRTVLEAYSRDLVGMEDEHRTNLHKYGLFSADQVFQKIGALSVGQRRKLQIARLIAQKANVLILDEPTNHLDLESVEQFEQALMAFPGTVLAISHDRTFIARVATVTWAIEAGSLVVERGTNLTPQSPLHNMERGSEAGERTG